MLPAPTQESLTELLDLAAHRVARAWTKYEAAEREVAAAETDHEAAANALAAWHALHPDPQITIFEGETHV